MQGTSYIYHSHDHFERITGFQGKAFQVTQTSSCFFDDTTDLFPSEVVSNPGRAIAVQTSNLPGGAPKAKAPPQALFSDLRDWILHQYRQNDIPVNFMGVAPSATFPSRTFHLMPGMMMGSLPFLQEAPKGKALDPIDLIFPMNLKMLSLRSQTGKRKMRKKPLEFTMMILGKPLLNSPTTLDLPTLMRFLSLVLFLKLSCFVRWARPFQLTPAYLPKTMVSLTLPLASRELLLLESMSILSIPLSLNSAR